MKIVIPSSSNSMDSLMDERFGRAKYFCIYDTDTDEYSFIENTWLGQQHGVGVRTSSVIAEKDVSMVIAPNIGPKAGDILRESGIDVRTSEVKPLKQIIEEHRND
ncbi:MAG: NifB/NifX family molybdenum-iron cluster-binding protein [bacterium]